MLDLFEIARRLSEAGVEFVIVGGVAIRSHGGNYVTDDLDVCYYRTRENIKKIADVLAPLNPHPRGLDKKLPFVFDWTTLQHGTNFTLETEMGDVDLLGEVKGVGDYVELAKVADTVDLDGYPTKILSISGLIAAKEAVNREKDKPGLMVLYALQESSEIEEDSSED